MLGRSSDRNEEPFIINVWGQLRVKCEDGSQGPCAVRWLQMSFCVQAWVWGSVTRAVTPVNMPSCLCVAGCEWLLPFWVKIQNVAGVGLEQRWPLVAVKSWVNRRGFWVNFWDFFSGIVHSPDSQCEVFCRHHGHGVCRQFQESLSLKWSAEYTNC